MPILLDVPATSARKVEVDIPAPAADINGHYDYYYEFRITIANTELPICSNASGLGADTAGELYFPKSTVLEIRSTGNSNTSTSHGVTVSELNVYRVHNTFNGTVHQRVVSVNGVVKATYTLTTAVGFAIKRLFPFGSTTRAGTFDYFQFVDNKAGYNKRYDANLSNGTGESLPPDGVMVSFPTGDSKWIEYGEPASPALFEVDLSSNPVVLASLQTNIVLNSEVSLDPSLTVLLETAVLFTTAISLNSSITSNLETSIHLTSSVNISASLQMNLRTTITFLAVLESIPSLTADLFTTTELAFEALLSSVSFINADLNTLITFNSIVNSNPSISANLVSSAIQLYVSLTANPNIETNIETAILMNGYLLARPNLVALLFVPFDSYMVDQERIINVRGDRRIVLVENQLRLVSVVNEPRILGVK